MKSHFRPRSHFVRSRVITAALVAWLTASTCTAISAFALTITGTITNGTTQKPVAGDSVVLIALRQRMEEVARTKTDAQGRFSIDAPDPGMHLIRVDHQGAPYFQAAPPNTTTVNVEVYDVGASVPGVTTEANVMQIQTDGQGLSVIQSFFVKNASDPPRTQFSNHSYEIYLPPGAQIEGSAAQGPGGMPVQSSPMPVGKNLYSYLFPIRPGETHFQVSYHLPYSGSLALAPRVASATDNFVVILPRSMSFLAGTESKFQPLNEKTDAQTFLARNVLPSQSIGFKVSGSGQLPRDTAAGAGDATQGSASTDNRPGGGLGVPIDTPDPLHKYKWWLLGAIALAFTLAAGFLLSKPSEASTAAPLATAGSAPLPTPQGEDYLLTALKNELFAIETDRLQGRITESEYGDLKSALEVVLRRAITR